MAVFQDKDKNGKVIKTKDGRSWYYVSYKDGKHYKSKKYKTQKEAKDEESLFLLKRDMPLNKPLKIIWIDYITELTKKRKDSTVYSYEKDYNGHIKPYFENMYINTITVENIREWALNLEKKGLSISYMNKIHNILNQLFDFSIKNYGLISNPSRIFGSFEEKNNKIINDNEKIRYITLEQFKQFVSVIDNQLYKTFFTFAFYTGCRRGEIQALTWNDIDFVNKEITINKTLYEEVKGKVVINSTKNNLNRKIKMSNTLINILQEYYNYVKQYTDFSKKWYVFGNSRFLPKTTIDRYKHKYFQLSGVNEITMHEFRHSHVSLLINEYIKTSKEKNVKTDTAKFFLMMSNRMGHSIDVMQNTYMHLFPTVQDEIIDLLNNL